MISREVLQIWRNLLYSTLADTMENNVKINHNYLVFYLMIFGIFFNIKSIESNIGGKC